MAKRQYFGETTSDDWEAYTSGTTSGLKTYVDLSHLNLKNIPHVTVSLEGDSNTWLVTGGSDVNTLFNKGFSVLIRSVDGQSITPATAKGFDWHVAYTVTSAPVARFDATTVGLVVTVDGSKSSDEDGALTDLTWDFGDNTPVVTGVVLPHTYGAVGTYKITLTAKDRFGVINRVSKKVTVTEIPANVFFSLNTVQNSGGVSRSLSASSDPALTAEITQTGGGPAEQWDATAWQTNDWVGKKWVFLTRGFGANYQRPYIKLTTTKTVKLDTMSFLHYHNHNAGKSSYPNYQVGLQISTSVNSGYSNIGLPFLASPTTHMKTQTINLDATILQPGTYYIQWVPTNIVHISDDYFALDDISLNVKLLN
jgi:PKD repeat protein